MKKIVLTTLTIILITTTLRTQDLIPSNTLIFNKLAKNKNITAPYISFDGNYLIFVVIENENYTFYECKKNNNNWTEPQELSDINKYLGPTTPKNSPVYNYDASEIYFEATQNQNKDIYYSQRINTGWTQPQKLNNKINTQLNEGDPCISADNNTLYFIRYLNPKNEEYGTIFTAKRINNQWDSVNQIIEPITLGLERTPRILIDNKTLLFSSIRDKQSSMNIYLSKNLYDDSWIIPMSIGKFSKDNDLYPSLDNQNNLLYFSTIQNKREAQINYSLAPNELKPEKFITIVGKIENPKNQPIKGQITLHNPISLDIVSNYSNNLNEGEFMLFVPTQTPYIIDITAPNHSHYIYYLSDTLKNTKQLTINAQLFDKVDLTLKTFDNLVFEPLQAQITILDSNQNPTNIEEEKINKGLYKITFPIGNKYQITLENEYSQPETIQIDLTGSILYNKIEKNIEFKTSKIQTTLNISDATNRIPIKCTVTLTNTSTQQQITFNATTDNKGNITITGRKGDTYNIAISPKGYSFFTLELTLNDTTPKIKQVKLEPLQQNTIINLKNINFETNSSELTKDALPELKKVIDLLKNNPNIKIEISAHTDDKGSDVYNNLLSERRAKSVVDYLIQNDIPAQRMISKGYGKTKPLVPNTSEQNRAINRRVELKIIEI